MLLENATIVGDSPVFEKSFCCESMFLSITGHVKSCKNLGGPPSKAKY